MRIVTFDELPDRLDLERSALQLSGFSSAVDGRTLRLLRRRKYAVSEYLGVFALEGSHVVGQALVYRFPYTGSDGPRLIAGIAAVTTRVDAAGRGIARALLEEVHRREADAGTPYALLWTNRALYAHHLYEALGYRDVFAIPLAVRPAPRRGPAPGTAPFRPARPADLPRLEALHHELASGRTGFTPRLPGFFRTEHVLGTLSLEDLLVYGAGSAPVGYALVSRGPSGLSCGELVGPREELPAMLRGLERSTKTGVLALGYTPVLDLARTLRSRGYLGPREDWHVLMARQLPRPREGADLRRELAIDRPSFLCQRFDAF